MNHNCLLGILMFLLFGSYNSNDLTTEDNYWKKFDDGEDDYDNYSNEENKEKISVNNINESHILNSSSTKKFFAIESTTFKTKFDLNKRRDAIITKCPDFCGCDDDFHIVNCSNRNLESLPKMLPNSMEELDLSYNLIKNIQKNDLDFLINMRKIMLNNNEIETLDKSIFVNNINLQKINLANNKINEIDPNTFSNIPHLSVLDLSNNAIKIPKIGSFLNAPDLKILVLTNCSINELYDDTFKNTTRLIELMLDQNDFKKKINTQAFNISMQKLVKLTLPDIEHPYILELCQILQSIDNISFKNFNISCFEMIAGMSFNESLILSETQIPMLHQKNVYHEHNRSIQHNTTNNFQNLTKLPVGQTSSMENISITNELNATIGQNDNENNKNDENFISISSEIVNYCLFAIMGIAIVGLLIGVICRKDFYGIKTKLCRTKKTRGPAKADQIKATEEIPLNKV